MNEKFEDRLIELAFGDMNESDAMQLERELSQSKEASQALEELRAFKLDLSRLKEIPAPQLSTERLRDRILNEGLRPSRGVPWLVRLWAPTTAVAAFALAFFMMQNRTASVVEPSLVARLDASKPMLDVKPFEARGEPSSSVVNKEPVAVQIASNTRFKRPVRKSARRPRQDTVVAAVSDSTKEAVVMMAMMASEAGKAKEEATSAPTAAMDSAVSFGGGAGATVNAS